MSDLQDLLAPARRTNWALGRPSMVVAENLESGYRVGYILTRHGVVGLYDQVARDRTPAMTSLSVVAGGRYISATWDRPFSDRYLKTLATRFAAEVFANPQAREAKT